MTILITGGKNSLSIELSKLYKDVLMPNSDELDLANKKNIEQFFDNHHPDIVIHNASLLNVRICEEQQDLAVKVNVTYTKNLIEVIQNKNFQIKFIHISTPCIFDGDTGMYVESSIPKPVNFYGKTRLDGEKEVEKLSEYTIIRTNYVSKKKWPYPKAFTDRFGTYLFSDQVAQGIFDVCNNNLTGIVHIVGNKKISMYDLAKLTTPEIQPMTMDNYAGPQLTVDMSLDTNRWKQYKIN